MKNRMCLQIILIAILAFLVYFNTLWNGFFYDDELLIVYNPTVKSFSNIPEIFTHHFFNKSNNEYSITFYRPITTLTYLLNYRLFKVKGFYYHLTNILLHCAVSLLLFWLCLLLFSKFEWGRRMSMIAAALFATHPIHTETVAFISGRTDLLAAFFILISLICYLKWRSESKTYFYILACISFVLGVFSKEVTIVLPALIILIEYLESDKKLLEFIKTDFKKVFLYSLPFFVLGASYFFMRVFILKLPPPPYPTGNFYTTQLLMQKVFLYYIKLLIIPTNLMISYIDYFTKSETLFRLDILAAIIANIIIALIAIWALIKKNIFALCFFWFFITLLPVLNILPLGMICAERYLYIPSIGFCIIIGYLISRNDKRSFIIIVSTAILIIYSIVTFQRNIVWSNPISLWEDTIKKNPNDYVVQLNLAKALLQSGNYKEAEKYILQVLSNKQAPYRHLQIEIYGRCLIEEGKYKQGIEELQKIPQIKPDYYDYLNYIGEAYYKDKEYKKAEEYFRKAIEKNTLFAPPRLNLINLYIKEKRFDDALKEWNEVEKINPDIGEIYVFKGYICQSKGDFQQAIIMYQKALTYEPNNSEAHFNLGFIYDTFSEKDKKYIVPAIQEYEIALQNKKDYVDAMLNLGILYARIGQNERAKELWNNVLLIDKENTTAKENLKIMEGSKK